MEDKVLIKRMKFTLLGVLVNVVLFSCVFGYGFEMVLIPVFIFLMGYILGICQSTDVFNKKK